MLKKSFLSPFISQHLAHLGIYQYLIPSWEAAEFKYYINNVPDEEFLDCLPDCNTVIYEPLVTAVPFRRCDLRNLGVSTLCNLDDPFLPEPRNWAQQVLKELSKTSLTNPAFIQRYKLRPAQRSYSINDQPQSAFNPANETYDYQLTISIYFDRS